MKRILVVDDDLDILTLERKILEKAGYDVVTAMDGRSAVELASVSDFDLVLLDVMMPGMDGFEVSRELQDKKGGVLPVVFVTARDDSESMREGFRSGGSVFLSKPFTASQLIRIVGDMLGSRA